jgi:site-specific DNA recombinase
MTKPFKIGLYARVSTEEQAENPEGSIKNQEQRLRDYVKFKNGDGNFGEIIEVFIDAGISAKDMQRPQLQRLISKIQAHEIDLVLVTDLSRFTRSTKDFSYLWDFLKVHNCKFLSLRENFDSTNAAGEMIMHTLANFAQFERRQTAERISLAFAARAKRGLYNGGSVPLGYKISSDWPGVLEVIEEEAELVRLIFSTFLNEGTLSLTAKKLNNTGVKIKKQVQGGGGPRVGFFKIDLVYRILTNRSYLGLRIYKERGEEKLAKAAWPAIVDEDIFMRTQKILTKNKSAKKPHSANRYPYLLSGITLCKACGFRMAGKSAHGRNGKVAYYEHSWANKANAAYSKKVFHCEPHRILAKKIEPVVWQSVKEFLTDEKIAQEMIELALKKFNENDGQKELLKSKNKLTGTKFQIEALAERISTLPRDLDPKPIYDQMTKLQTIQKELEEKIVNAEKEKPSQDNPIDLKSLSSFTQGLKALLQKEDDPVIKTMIIQKIVEKILVKKDGIEIYFNIGQDYYKRELGLNSGAGSKPYSINDNASKASILDIKKGPHLALELSRSTSLNFFSNSGSISLTNGRHDWARTSDLNDVNVAL